MNDVRQPLGVESPAASWLSTSMCNRYTPARAADIKAGFPAPIEEVFAPMQAFGTVGPFAAAPFIRPKGNAYQEVIGQWGMIRPGAKERRSTAKDKRPVLTNNARSETMAKLPTYRDAWANGHLPLKSCMIWLRSLFLALLLLAAPMAQADELAGQVVGITDGDTLRVLVDQREVVVRLAQIDAPEKRQPFGQRSRQSLNDLVFQKQVRVETEGRDRYGRTLGTVFVGGINVNAEQVRRGMAWAYVRYLRGPSLSVIEGEARETRRGLWVDADPVAPWEWRRAQ